MAKIRLKDVSRKYVIDKKEEFYAIRSISLMFENNGLISIVGKSGSGKSTILNLIAKLDEPTSGQIFYEQKDISKLNRQSKNDYFKKKIGILFQSYNLIDTETAIYNVMLPLEINGASKKEAISKAKEVLKYVGISEELQGKKVEVLSGGERQRVSLARTLVNEPEVILCDEPTGALDIKNSENVMRILKKYSENNLVINVSHNLQQVKKYSDRIIEIEDGKIKSDKLIKKIKPSLIKKERKSKKSTRWISFLSFSNYKRRIWRNIFTSFSLSISLISAFIAIGFTFGKDNSIDLASRRQFDYSSGIISKQEEISKGSLISLSRSVRPELDNVLNNEKLLQNFNICLNFDAILSQKPSITYDESNLDELLYTPIYSFTDKGIDKSLLIKGEMPAIDSLNEVVINEKGYDYLTSKLSKNIIGESILIKSHTSATYIDFDSTYITDDFNYERHAKIVGVVTELDYLQEPKMYYSYVAFEEYTKEVVLPNLSTYLGNEKTWFDRISEADNFDSITSFSFRAFPKDISAITEFSDISLIDLTFSSPSLLIRDSLLNFMEVAKYGIFLFLGITVLGTILIMGIMSFTSYSEDRKVSAILSCLGATNDEISEIYLNESLLNGFISISFSLFISYFLSIGINAIVKRIVGLDNLINIPFVSFLNIPFLFPIFALVIGLSLSAFITVIPIIFSKRISLKEELKSL